MKTKLLLVCAMSLCLGVAAYAQTAAPDAPPPAPGAPKDEMRMPPPPPGEDAMSDDDDAAEMAPPAGPRGHGPDRMGPRGPRHGPRGMMPPPPPSKAADFRIENGPFKFQVKCAEDEPMQACADIAIKMLAEAKNLPAR